MDSLPGEQMGVGGKALCDVGVVGEFESRSLRVMLPVSFFTA